MTSLGVAPAALSAARAFAEALRARYGADVVAVRLFGSYARGEANEESDVDLAVVMTELNPSRYRDVIDLATDLALDLELLLAPMVFDRATYEKHLRQGRPLVMDIERDGVAL